MLRWRLEPVDWLLPTLVAHERLGFVVAPGSGGHDAWGFRNREVPERAALVAIGDSQTYGWSVRRADAWPAQLEALLGKRVYNLSLGGYGPPEYLELLRSHAARLAPREVVIALYPGNDLWGAAESQRGADPPPPGAAPDRRPLGALRSALARHSVLYQAAKPAVERALPGLAERARRDLAGDAAAREIALEAGERSSVFAPETRLAALDLGRGEVRDGLAHTLELLDAIAAHCEALAVRCHLLRIPTKESVYAELAAERLGGEERRRLLDVARAEDRVVEAIRRHQQARGRELVDTLPALRRALAAGQSLYPRSHDGHPGAAGHAVIARAVADALASSPRPAGE